MPNERRKPNLDLQVYYSGFKIEELEYIGYSRNNGEDEGDFLETFNGKLDDGGLSEQEDEDLIALGGFGSGSFSTEGYQSYLCSTPNNGRKHRGSFSQADVSAFAESEILGIRSLPTKLDSGIQSQNISAANSAVSFFGDENDSNAGSLESLHGSFRFQRDQPSMSNMRKRIELDSDVHDPYSNVDELELSIEEEVSHLSQGHGNTSTLGTLKRRLSLKVIRRNISTGLFGSYLQRVPALPPSTSSNQPMMSSEQAPLIENKQTGPVNLWFRKFRSRHYI